MTVFVRDNSSSCGEDKDYWNFISESLSNSVNSPGYARVQRAVLCVASLSHLESPLGKGRALIRWSLMYKMLPGELWLQSYVSGVTNRIPCVISK